jgi:catechol 2,3-dioxygenase-like lactoylglutathione lyase family enzyme
MDWTLEVVVLPVSDIDRSIAFYRDQIGFALDHDTITPHMHVTQLTPPGSVAPSSSAMDLEWMRWHPGR